MAHWTSGGSSAALKGCATRKEVARGVLGQAPRRSSENAANRHSRASGSP
jgi:hypothetical protein